MSDTIFLGELFLLTVASYMLVGVLKQKGHAFSCLRQIHPWLYTTIKDSDRLGNLGVSTMHLSLK